MADIWDYVKTLFVKAETSSPSKPLIHEMIKRTEEEVIDYEFWKNTLVCKRLKNWLNEQYIFFQISERETDESLDFLNTPSSKGFVIYFHKTRYSKRDVVHFFDYLREQVLAKNYRTQISDLRSYQRASWAETVQRHYLKPRPTQTEDGRQIQQFGNVTIELTFRNDKVYHLKFRATSYRDRLFEEAYDFHDLLNALVA